MTKKKEKSWDICSGLLTPSRRATNKSVGDELNRLTYILHDMCSNEETFLQNHGSVSP